MANIAPLSNPLGRLHGLHGVSFTPGDGGRDVGLSLQEVEATCPEATFTDKDGTQKVDLAKIVPLLVEAVNTLCRRVQRLEAAAASA